MASVNAKTDYMYLYNLSHTEHTAYTVGHPCKQYIQPNQPWSYPSYTRAIRVYPWKPCMLFKTLKELARMSCPCMIVQAIVQDRERPCETVWGRIYTTVHEVHFTSGLNRVNIVYKSLKSHEAVSKSSIQRSVHMVSYDRTRPHHSVLDRTWDR